LFNKGQIMKASKVKTLKSGAAPLVMGLAMISVQAQAQESIVPANPVASSAAQEAPTIVVTGSLIKNPNLKSDAPITTVTAADLKTSGATNVEDLLNQMPQVFAGQTSSISNGSDGTASLNLRGLGAKRTLVLINGRRMQAGDPTTSYADLNFIPSALIKSIDLLTGGASTTYGADAVSGVVNFVIDKKIEGFHLTVNDGLYQHNNSSSYIQGLLNARTNAGYSGYSYPTGSSWDGNGIDITASYGHKFADGNGHIEAYVSFKHQNSVTQAARDYSACSLASNGKSCSGSATANPANGYFYAEGNTKSSTVGAFGNGGLSVGSPNRYNYAPTNYYMRNDKRWNAGMFADLDVSKSFHPYAEFMFMADSTNAQIAPSGDFGNTLTINCNNPYLTASQVSAICNSTNMVNGYTATGYPVTVGASSALQNLITTPANGNTAYLQLLWRNTIGAPRSDSLRHQGYRGVIGADGEISEAWNYSAYFEYARTAYEETYYNDVSISRLTDALNAVTNSSGNVVCASGNAGCSPLNLFSGTPSAASLAYITGNGTKTGYTGQINLSGQLSGDLTNYGIKTPWSTTGLNLAIGGDFRRESTALHPDSEFTSGDLAGQGGATLPLSGSYEVFEGVIEAKLPIIENKLNFGTGYRFSHYSLSTGRTFNTNTYKFELDYTPVHDVRLRTSFNHAVRAPTLSELFSVQHVSLDGSTDPCTSSPVSQSCVNQGVSSAVAANPAGQYNGLQGGNTNLKPEQANTLTAGVVITPSALPGFNLSVDYYKIKIKDAIQQYGADAILNACNADASSSFCSLINRAPNGSLWMSTSGYVVDIYHNVGYVQTQGFDINASYAHSLGHLGRLTARLAGTVLTQMSTNNGVSQTYDCAGYYGTTCGTPSPIWRHRATLTWDTNTKAKISTTLTWRYYGPVDQDATQTNNQTLAGTTYDWDRHIGAYSYFDLAISGQITQRAKLMVGANNLFDIAPPLVGTSACYSTYCNGNTYPGVYDALGRYIHATFSLDF